MPKRPLHVDKKIKDYIRSKVPHFFIHAKNKKERNVELINNSPVNRLSSIIPDKRIFFKKVAGEFDYKMLMRNKQARTNEDIVNKYEDLNSRKKWLMRSSDEETQEYYYVDAYIRQELLKVNNNPQRVVDVLVDLVYGSKSPRSAAILWDSFGDVLLENLKKNLSRTFECQDCGKRVDISSNRAKYCKQCSQKNRKKTQRKTMRERRK